MTSVRLLGSIVYVLKRMDATLPTSEMIERVRSGRASADELRAVGDALAKLRRAVALGLDAAAVAMEVGPS
jgi:hypothetical protein